MAKQTIDTTSPGDTAADGGDKINANFTELYARPDPTTWTGSSNITTLGTIGTGTWQGTAIGDTYISSAATWNAKLGTGAIGVSVQAYSSTLTTWAGKTAPSGTVIGTTDTQTLTNKRITVRAVALSYASTVTVDVDATDVANIAALTGPVTIATTGTATDGQKLVLRMAQDGTGSRTISWSAAFVFGADVTAALIPSTASAKWEMVFQWSATDATWRAVGIARGF